MLMFKLIFDKDTNKIFIKKTIIYFFIKKVYSTFAVLIFKTK